MNRVKPCVDTEPHAGHYTPYPESAWCPGASEVAVRVETTDSGPARLWITDEVPWWTDGVARTALMDAFTAELIKALTEPIDPDEPSNGCFR